MDFNDFVAANRKIDEILDLANSGQMDTAQQLHAIEAIYTQEYSEMLRDKGLSDRDTKLAVWIVETAVFRLNMNIVECYNNCVRLIEYHPEGSAPNKLMSILGLVQAIMADNLFRLIHDELCVRENIVTQFNDLCAYAYGNLENYEGSMNAEAVQEQMNNLNRKFKHAKAIVEYVRDGIEPVRHDTGEKIPFALAPEQIEYINAHPEEFNDRMIMLAKKQPVYDFLCNYAKEYMDSGPDIFDYAPEKAEKFASTYCEYIPAHSKEKILFSVHFAFVSTVSHFPAFMYGSGFVPVDLFKFAVYSVVQYGSQSYSDEKTLEYVLSLRDTAGRTMCSQIYEDPTYDSSGADKSSWHIAFEYIESLAKQYGWVDPSDR